MQISKLINSKLQSTDIWGQKIKFPRLQKNKYYVIANRVLRYDGINGDLAEFTSPNNEKLSMTRRKMAGVYIEKLGDISNLQTGFNTSVDVFSNGKTLSQVLDEIKTREFFV